MARRHTTFLTLLGTLVVVSAAWRPRTSTAAERFDGVFGVVFLDKKRRWRARQRGEPGFEDVVVALFGKRNDGHSIIYLVTSTDREGRFALPGARFSDGAASPSRPAALRSPPGGTRTFDPQRTFYAAANGDDHNPGTRQQPFRTIGRAVPMLQPGDMLYIRQGEYREYLSPVEKPLGGGTGSDHPIVLAGMPGETVVIRPPDGPGPM